MSKTKSPIKKFIMNVKFLFIVFLCLGFLKIAYSQYVELNGWKYKVLSLKRQINQQNERRKVYLEQKKKISTEQYVEKVARDKYGMVKPGEIVFDIGE